MQNNHNICSFKGVTLSMGALFALLILVGACSTTRRLGEDEVLYTGVKNIKINPTDDEKLPDALVSELKQAVNVKPNDPIPFLSPARQSPFPYRLWAYNYWNDSAKGVLGWLYRTVARPPVLMSDVKAPLRTKMVENILADNGYFGSTATYEEVPNAKNPKKASMSYTFDVSSPYRIDTIEYFNTPSSGIKVFIDSLARKSKWFQKGAVFCVDSLSTLRVEVANNLRNRGYYYFRPEYLEFLADTFLTPHAVAMRLSLADNLPGIALRKFRTGNVVTLLQRNEIYGPGRPDTIQTDRGELIIMRPQRVRKGLIPECITFRKGKVFSVRDMDRTQTRLARMGIFSNIQIQPIPDDTASKDPVMNVFITCRYDRPMEASIEVNATSKSNSYIGPGLIASFTHNNIFGGAEKLNVSLNADYEWQTGHNRSSVFNSYEFGLQTSVAFPRLLAPKFIPRSKRDVNWTTVSLGGSVLNRPKYFMMAEYNMGITYEWRATRHATNSFTPFKLTYNKLIRTTEDFDSVMAMNPAVALSFESRFIPQLSYTYTYSKWLEREQNNELTFTGTFTEAGNLFDVCYDLAKVKGVKKLFGTPFSQFVKGQVQLVWNHRLFPKQDQWIVSRVLLGAAHAYGNAKEVPYSEQFYIGGANSIRAFTVRSIGPGSYRAPKELVNGYFDQTGTFKFELNTEYRFPIVGDLHGAAFIDAGNIWLLKDDPLRPGGLLQGKTFLKDIALGTGAGLRYDLGMMVVRVDVGYGLHTPYSNGTPHYFNVPFKNAFAVHLALGYPF
ncbi:MAG: BamA/TamA family outer membrane protein [Muribaculaceae bacterium]|nr:BamA/TamA family outer membrane protein [Muribaculaceae bacterium]